MTLSKTSLKLYGFPRSTYVNVVRLVLHAKGLRYDFHDTETEMYTPTHLERHPFRRVPVLQHGDFWLYETTAIALYLEELFPEPPLLPADPRQRAVVHQWMSNLNAYFYPSVIFSLVHERLVFRELGIPADEAVVADALPKIERCLEVTTNTLRERSFLAGDAVTMADYFLLPTLIALSLVSEGAPLLARFPAIGAWLERMALVPSVRDLRATLPAWAPIEHARRWVVDHRARGAVA